MAFCAEVKIIDETPPPLPQRVGSWVPRRQALLPLFAELHNAQFGRRRAYARFRGNAATHSRGAMPRQRGIDSMQFGRLDVPFAALVASTANFPGFNRTQDHGFVQSRGCCGCRKAVGHNILLRWWVVHQVCDGLVSESLIALRSTSRTVVINCAGKMIVEFFSIEISAIVWRVRS